jgi:CRP-like cAMP-binding protein
MGQAPLCKYFDFIQRSHIAAICEVATFQAGSVIIQEGTDGDTLYLVAKGTLEVLMKSQHVAYKKPGDFLGEVALIQQVKRTATLVAKEDSVLLSLKRQDLMAVFKKDPVMEKSFYKGMLEMILEQMVKQGQEIAQMRGV